MDHFYTQNLFALCKGAIITNQGGGGEFLLDKFVCLKLIPENFSAAQAAKVLLKSFIKTFSAV